MGTHRGTSTEDTQHMFSWSSNKKNIFLTSLVFLLRFYGRGNPLGSCITWSVYLLNHTFSWVGLDLLAVNQYLCTFFHQKLTTISFLITPCIWRYHTAQMCKLLNFLIFHFVVHIPSLH